MRKLVLALCALVMLAAACRREEGGSTYPNDPNLTLTSDSVAEFEAEGGRGVISYTYNSGNVVGDNNFNVEIELLQIACNAEWIDIAKEAAPLGELSYYVAKNETTEPRETTIKASINNLSFEVTVRQSAGEPAAEIVGWGIVGTMNDWDVEQPLMLTEQGDYYGIKSMKLSATDRFKFVKNGDNALNRGGNGLAAEPDHLYPAQQWGSDIHVSTDGTYDIYLSAKENAYYIMSEGKSPAEAIEPLAPGEKLYEVRGNIEGDKVRMVEERRYMVAKEVKFTEDVAKFFISINEDQEVYGAQHDSTYNVDEEIALSSTSEREIIANVEAGVSYDICLHKERKSLWIMPTGSRPFFWESATGVAFSTTNFAIFLESEDLDLYFDFNCASPALDRIIPEGTYYVDNENDGGNNFNLEAEYHLRIQGIKTHLKDGTMTIKHIAGGYDIAINVSSILNHQIDVRYVGPIGEQPLMGNPIANPE